MGRADRGDAPVGIGSAANDPEGTDKTDRYSARMGERSSATRVGLGARRTLCAGARRHQTNVFFKRDDDVPKRARDERANFEKTNEAARES